MRAFVAVEGRLETLLPVAIYMYEVVLFVQAFTMDSVTYPWHPLQCGRTQGLSSLLYVLELRRVKPNSSLKSPAMTTEVRHETKTSLCCITAIQLH